MHPHALASTCLLPRVWLAAALLTCLPTGPPCPVLQHRVVFDEGHTLKSSGSKLFKVRRVACPALHCVWSAGPEGPWGHSLLVRSGAWDALGLHPYPCADA